MRVRNKHLYSTDQELLVTLRQEYIMLGFFTTLERGHLVVHARRPPRKAKKEHDKTPRNKRAEKHRD